MPDDKTMTLDDFAERLITEKNYTSITPAMREELKNEIKERTQDFLIARTIAKLSDEDAKRLNDLLDTNPDEKQMQEFINASIQDAPKFIGDALFQFRQTYLGLA